MRKLLKQALALTTSVAMCLSMASPVLTVYAEDATVPTTDSYVDAGDMADVSPFGSIAAPDTWDTEAANTEAANTEAADTEAADTEPADAEAADTEAADTETADTETADAEPAAPEPEAQPAEPATPETTAEPLTVLNPENPVTTANVGDTVTLSVDLNREDVEVTYQWQVLRRPSNSDTDAEPIYNYAEDEPTWYVFPLDGVSEYEALQANPDMTWNGIETYLAVVDALDEIGEDSTAASLAWRTENYALEGYAIHAANVDGQVQIYADKGDTRYTATLNSENKWEFDATEGTAAYSWQNIEGATDSRFSFEVTESDFTSSYRCAVTATDADYLAQCARQLADNGTELTDEQRAADQVLYSLVMTVESPEEAAPEAADDADIALYAATGSSTTPHLSADAQWIEGLNNNYQYITKDTYDRAYQWYKDEKIDWTQFNRYWTSLAVNGWSDQRTANALDSNGFPTGETRTYNGFTLTNGALEVNSEWYGKTVYFRVAGSSGTGTAIDIPAYTDLTVDDNGNYIESSAGTRYKKAITFLNPYVQDSSAMYGKFIAAISDADGWLLNMDGSGNLNGCSDIHIRVYTIECEDFNRDPARYMLDAEGNYRMDSVGWGVCTSDEPDLSGKAYWQLNDYIANGYGFLTGHDTLYAYAGAYYDAYGTDLDESSIDPNDGTTWYYSLNSWLPYGTTKDGQTNNQRGGHFYMNQLMGSNKGNINSGTVSPSDAPGLILSTGGSHGSYGKNIQYGGDSIRITQTGHTAAQAAQNPKYRTPANYPYSFTAGQVLQGSFTHTNQQAAFGTIWADYNNNLTDDLFGCYEDALTWTIHGRTGTNNFYLSGNGNYLMNQIGHLPTNAAYSYESALFANSVMYVSQRKQCEICAANQSGQETVHFVQRINSTNFKAVTDALRSGGSYWYPLDGCYMLTEDITLPEDWTPIAGFTGHWNSDGHTVDLPASGAPLLTSDTADKPTGWNLGTDKTIGVTTVFGSDMTCTTGVARVVGFLKDLGFAESNLGGYRVEVLGTDSQTYSCTTNSDGKYVLSNLPVTGTMAANVYDPSGAPITNYGVFAVTIPNGSGIVSLEGRTQDFWSSCETTALYPLDFTAIPPEPQTRWVSQDADFLATIITTSEYSADYIHWQYKLPSGTWTDIAGSGIEHKVTHLGYVDTGDSLTSGTQSRLTLRNLPLALDGTEVRIRYAGKNGDRYSGSALLTVKEPQMRLSISGSQTLWVKYADQNGTPMNYAVPGDKWSELFGEEYSASYASANNGNNEAVYTSTVLYLPELDERSTPTLDWKYRTGNTTDTESVLGHAVYNAAAGTWDMSYTVDALTALYPELSFEITATAPVSADETGTEITDGEWRKIVTTLKVSGASTEMDVGDTHFFFRAVASNEYGSGASYLKKTANSPDADLYVQYCVDIVPNTGSAVFGNGVATWTFPNLNVYAPNGLRTVILTFYQPHHNSSNVITVHADNPYGISVSFSGGDYIVLKSAGGNLIPQDDWQAFLRNHVSFTTYDTKDVVLEDVSWYISENEESQDHITQLFDGTTNGWSASTEVYGYRQKYNTWNAGAPDDWGGYNYNIRVGSFSANGSSLTVQTDSGSTQKSWASPWNVNYYTIRGWNTTLTKTFNATSYNKLYLDASTSWQLKESGGYQPNSVMTVGGKTLATTSTGGLVAYDISDLTGMVTLSLANRCNTDYALPHGVRGDWNNCVRPNAINQTETSTIAVRKAILTQKSFERTNHSAIKYSELWSNNQKHKLTVSLTADPEKIYDGTSSAAYLTVSTDDGGEEFVLTNATLTYFKGDYPVSSGSYNAESLCKDQGSYRAVVTLGAVVTNRYDVTGLDIGSSNTISTTFKINPRGLKLSSLYLADPDKPKNVKRYDGTTTATICNITLENIVPGDGVTTDKTSYLGTFAMAQAGESLTAEGRPLPDRLKKLEENVITRTEDISLVNNEQGNYYIASEDYSGAISRTLLEVHTKSERKMYGAADMESPWFIRDFDAKSTGSVDGWLSITGLEGKDTLHLEDSFAFGVADKDGHLFTLDSTTPVGVYPVTVGILTETDYPVLRNYIVAKYDGVAEIYPREIVVTPTDLDWYVEDDGTPTPFAKFEMLNDDEKSYTNLGTDADTDYTAMPLIGGDTVASVLGLYRDGDLTAYTEYDKRSVFGKGSNISYSTEWYSYAPTIYLDVENDPTLEPCAWCENRHGFALGTDHWKVSGYVLRINQNADEGGVLTVAAVQNPLGETVQNYTLRYVDGLLRVHPKLRFQLRATVPLYVCMYGYAGDGSVVTPTNYGITNLSNGAIKVTEVTVGNKNDRTIGWSIVDKDTQNLQRGEMTMRLNGLQLTTGGNAVSNPEKWRIPADTQQLLPLTCYIAGGNVNERQESYVTSIAYTVAEYGVTVPEVDGVEIPDTIHGEPVTKTVG